MKHSNNTQFRIRTIIIILLSILFINNSSRRESKLDASAVAANNRGAGLMGQFNYEAARLVFDALARKYPDNNEIRINLAISIFNRQKKGDEKTALAMLAAVLEKDPLNLRARYCSGLLELHSGQPQIALKHFMAVIEADPGDADAHYFAAKTLQQLSRYTEALDLFKRTISLDNYIRSAYYGIIMTLRQLGKTDDAIEMIDEFQRLKNNPRSRLVEFKYTRMGRKSEVITLNRREEKPLKRPVGPVFETVRKVSVDGAIRWRTPHKSRKPAFSSVTVCDINNDGHPDVFMTGVIQFSQRTGNALLMGQPHEGNFSFAKDNPLTSITDVNAALWGDLNDDGLVDVYLCRSGPNQLWQQSEPGKWQNVTKSTATANGDYYTTDGVIYDADHDGDLDIFIVNRSGPNELFNNNRNGTFRPLAGEYGLTGSDVPSRSILVTDLDGDFDADVIILNDHPPHNVYINQRLWKYTPAIGLDAFISADVQAAVAGDIDADGEPEIYTLDGKGALFRWQRNSIGIWQSMVLNRAPKTAEQTYLDLALTDADGDGLLDFIVSGSRGWRTLAIEGNKLKPLFTYNAKNKANLEGWSLISSLKGPFFMGWSPGEPPLLWSPGSGRYGFATLSLTGRKDKNSGWRSNASGIGTKIAVRVDSRWTVLDTFRNHSGPGQGLQPVSIGSGRAAAIDFIALDWSDGVYQTELSLETGKHHSINETQRQLSSCPVLFAWNGNKYEFVSDFLGVGGIGYAVAPGEYSQPRPWENFLMPAGSLESRDGRLLIKLTEPMEEAAYIDAVRLKAYHLPPGWSMVLDERMGINGPAPSGSPRFYQNSISPVKAVNHLGRDVTAAVNKRDLKAAPPGKLDHRFIGLLQEDHVLTLTFETTLDSFSGQPMLVADGWVEYPYSQTNFAAWQAGATYRAASLEVLTPNGQWMTILDQFGYPAGMPRRMSVPLNGLPKGVRTIRISTNQEVYWDRLAIAFAKPCPAANHHRLPLASAHLEQTGFARRTTYDQRLPYYDHDNRSPLWDCRLLEGFYTRFGDVLPLLDKIDYALVIFGPGEGIHLEFNAPHSPVPSGWTRVYVLETNGWCKDMDLYTGSGETVEPVPGRNKRGEKADALHNAYNTRYLSGKQ